MPRKGRKPIVGKREDIGRQTRENEYAELESALRRAWHGRPQDCSSFGYEPDDLDDEWDQRAGDY